MGKKIITTHCFVTTA